MQRTLIQFVEQANHSALHEVQGGGGGVTELERRARLNGTESYHDRSRTLKGFSRDVLRLYAITHLTALGLEGLC